MSADYKTKYLDIRSKLIRATDAAYRLGYEEGMKEGQQAAQQQQQEMAMQQQAMMQQGMGGEAGAEMSPEEQAMMEEQMAQEGGAPEEISEAEGSELDESIAELESLVAKGEKPKVTDIRKAVLALTSLRKSQKQKVNEQKATSSAQRRVVSGLLKKWEEETKSEYQDLETIIKEHGGK